jgi:hypothetical protein
MKAGDLEGKPYAKFWNPQMAPLSDQAREAIATGPLAGPLLPPLSEASRLLDPKDTLLENGYALTSEGALHVAVRTEMPGTSPAMVDWWFGWHSTEPQRYKLWHPRAHVHAAGKLLSPWELLGGSAMWVIRHWSMNISAAN